MFFLGSAYPLGKFGLNASVNPILFGALRMGIVFLCLIPFCKIKIPSKKYFDKIISKGVYILPLGNYLYTVGATYNREDVSDSLTVEGQSFLKERIDNILNLEYEILNSVAGVRPTVRDRRPLIGYHPENNRIGVFNGLGARGVLVGPYLSNQFVYSSLDTINRFN